MTEVDDDAGHRLAERVERAGARREQAGRARQGGLWAQVARVGTLGWLVALPIALGALLGHALDRRMGTGITWSLALMMVGVFAGGYALWRLGFEMKGPS